MATAVEAASPTKKEKKDSRPKHIVTLPKSVKTQQIYNPVFYVDPNAKPAKKMPGLKEMPRKEHMLLDAYQTYEAWRKDGFKGAWWWQHIKRGET